MNPCRFLIRLLVLVAVMTILPGGVAWAKPPHVLLIMVDDLGWMDLRCQGNDRLNTPRLDRLARQGVRFTHAYAAAPICSPWLVSIRASPRRDHKTPRTSRPRFWCASVAKTQ